MEKDERTLSEDGKGNVWFGLYCPLVGADQRAQYMGCRLGHAKQLAAILRGVALSLEAYDDGRAEAS